MGDVYSVNKRERACGLQCHDCDRTVLRAGPPESRERSIIDEEAAENAAKHDNDVAGGENCDDAVRREVQHGTEYRRRRNKKRVRRTRAGKHDYQHVIKLRVQKQLASQPRPRLSQVALPFASCIFGTIFRHRNPQAPQHVQPQHQCRKHAHRGHHRLGRLLLGPLGPHRRAQRRSARRAGDAHATKRNRHRRTRAIRYP
mmetsp:Transcript_15215/g.38970  ORF Transcript_15215/g.38970 Transcript_15215/m.38970 type:complete len:200 (-) Transcript_15215:322-921(-)